MYNIIFASVKLFLITNFLWLLCPKNEIKNSTCKCNYTYILYYVAKINDVIIIVYYHGN